MRKFLFPIIALSIAGILALSQNNGEDPAKANEPSLPGPKQVEPLKPDDPIVIDLQTSITDLKTKIGTESAKRDAITDPEARLKYEMEHLSALKSKLFENEVRLRRLTQEK